MSTNAHAGQLQWQTHRAAQHGLSAWRTLNGTRFRTEHGSVKVLTDSTGWQYVFYFLAGLASFIGIGAIFVIDSDATRLEASPTDMEADKRIDWIGGLVITAAVCLFTFSLTDSGIAERGWREPRMPSELLSGI